MQGHRRCSTGPRRASTRRAPPSRSLPRRPRSIRARSRPLRASTTPATASSTASRSTNFADHGPGRAVSARSSCSQALQHSVNSVFCNIGMTLGMHTLMDYARRFGFDAKPPIDLPSERSRRAACTRTRTPAQPERRRHSAIRAASPSARTSCSSRRCRWRWSPPRSRTAACDEAAPRRPGDPRRRRRSSRSSPSRWGARSSPRRRSS